MLGRGGGKGEGRRGLTCAKDEMSDTVTSGNGRASVSLCLGDLM